MSALQHIYSDDTDMLIFGLYHVHCLSLTHQHAAMLISTKLSVAETDRNIFS